VKKPEVFESVTTKLSQTTTVQIYKNCTLFFYRFVLGLQTTYDYVLWASV